MPEHLEGTSADLRLPIACVHSLSLRLLARYDKRHHHAGTSAARVYWRILLLCRLGLLEHCEAKWTGCVLAVHEGDADGHPRHNFVIGEP
jgi:hypothetical protein